MLKIQGLSFVEILFFKKNPLQDLLSSLNTLISTNTRIMFCKQCLYATIFRTNLVFGKIKQQD